MSLPRPVLPLLAATALLSGAARLRAQDPAGAAPAGGGPEDEPALAALVSEALRRNPDLRSLEQALSAARSRPAQLRALPDPMVSLTYTNDAWAPTLGQREMTTLGLMWSQDLPWPGKRRLRGEIASLEADEVEQQLARARLSAAASVRRAYFGLVQARAIEGLTTEQADLWRQIEGVARARYSVGQGNQHDVLRTQVELTRIGQILAEQESAAATQVAEINRLLDRAAETTLETSATLAAVSPAAELTAELERMRAVSPETAAARIALDRARLGVELAKKEYRPDLTIQAGYMNRGGLDPMWQAGVGVKLPLNRKRRASAVAEAEALLGAAEARVSAVELQLRLRTQERLAQLAAAQQITTLYGEGIVPQDRMSVEAAIASYQAGRVPFVTVFEALTTLYGDRVTLVRLLAGQARIRASLDEASLETTFDLPAMAPAALAAAPGSGGSTTGGTTGGAMGSMSR